MTQLEIKLYVPISRSYINLEYSFIQIYSRFNENLSFSLDNLSEFEFELKVSWEIW